MSEFLISIARVDGGKVLLTPGGRGERNLWAEIDAKATAQGIGVFRTTEQVRAAFRQAYEDVLFELKSEVQPPTSR